MTEKEYIERILKERQKRLNIDKQIEKGYIVSPDTGLLGHPTNIENAANLDEIRIDFSVDEKHPFDKRVMLDPLSGNGLEVRGIRLDSKKEEQDLQLTNGTYINLEEFADALEQELLKDDKDTIYVAWRTGKQLTRGELIRDIIKRVTNSRPYLVAEVGRMNDNFYEEIKVVQPNEKKNKKIDLGRFFARDHKIDLGNGKYILAFEIEKALTEYIRMGKVKKQDFGTIPPINGEELDDMEKQPPNGESTPENLGEDENVSKSFEEPGMTLPKPPIDDEEPSNTNDKEKPKPNPEDPNDSKDKEKPEVEEPIDKEKPKPNSDESNPEGNRDEIYELVLRKGKAPSTFIQKILPIILSLIALANLLGLDDEKITKFIEDHNIQAPYSVSQMETIDLEQQYINHLKSLGIIIGESTTVDEGIKFHESSDYDRGGKNKTGIFGSGLRAAGDYTVESISIILPDGTIEDTRKEGTSLESHINEVCKAHNLTIADITVRVHLTNPVAGWVDFADLGSKNNAANLRNPEVKLEESAKFKGVIQNFNGETISFQNGGEVVTIKVVDENGNLLAPGTQVVGSDGETYKINELTQETVTETREEVVGTKKKITISFNNLKAEMLLASLGVAALGAALGFLIKKNEEETAELTEEELNYLVNSAKRRFDSDSEFSKAVETLTGRTINPEISTSLDPAAQTLKDSLIDWNTTIEEVGNIKRS